MWLSAGGITSSAVGLSPQLTSGESCSNSPSLPLWKDHRQRRDTHGPSPAPAISISQLQWWNFVRLAGRASCAEGGGASHRLLGSCLGPPSAHHHPHWSGTSLRERPEKGVRNNPETHSVPQRYIIPDSDNTHVCFFFFCFFTWFFEVTNEHGTELEWQKRLYCENQIIVSSPAQCCHPQRQRQCHVPFRDGLWLYGYLHRHAFIKMQNDHMLYPLFCSLFSYFAAILEIVDYLYLQNNTALLSGCIVFQ